MIKIYDTLNKKHLTDYANKEVFISESCYKQKEKMALLYTLTSNKPVQDLVEIFGLILIDDCLSTI